MQKILQFFSVAEVFETIDSQIFKEFRQLPEYAFIGSFMWTILFYSILLTSLSESQQVLSWCSGLKVNTPADTTGLDWPGNDRQVGLPTYPAVPGQGAFLSPEGQHAVAVTAAALLLLHSRAPSVWTQI